MSGLPELLADRVLQTPTRTALEGAGESLTFADLWESVSGLASQLRQRGLRRVGLCGDNSVAWVQSDLACLIAGIVCVPVPNFFSTAQVEHLKQQAGLQGLLWAEPGVGRESIAPGVWLEHLARPYQPLGIPGGTAKITFTSGSTGTPKGVCLSVQQMTATTLALKQRLGSLDMGHHLCVLPLATLLENIAGVYLPLLMGSRVELAPLEQLGLSGSSGLDSGRLIDAVNRSRPGSLILVPELARVLVAAAEAGQLATDSFRFLAVGGGKVSPDLLARGRQAGLPLYEGYGLSECGSVVALNVPGDDRPGAVGKPLGHVRVAVSPDRQIQVSGNTHLGYLGESPTADQPLATGDLGSLDEDGFLSVDGRRKNLLITGFGRNVSPEWLESELVQATGAAQALVFGDGEPHLSALLSGIRPGTEHQLTVALEQLNARLPDYARLAAVYLRRQPFDRAGGYLTGNGRLRRDRMLQHLPALLAEASSIDLNSSPMQSSGGNPMAFFQRLQTETEQAREHVQNAPVIRAIQQGDFDLKGYTWFLTQAYHHVKHTVPLMMACGSRLPERLESVREALVEYIDEEYGHHEWILNDLEACGVDKDSVRCGTPDVSIELMVAYLYDQIHRGNPAAFFGMVQVLEGTSIELATPLGQKIQQQLGLPNQAFSYLYSHGALDQEHFQFFRKLMDGITDPNDQQAIIDSARMVYRLYGDMLHSIPLPQGSKETHHEAA